MELFPRPDRITSMGEIRVKTKLENNVDIQRKLESKGKRGKVRAVELEAIVDTGAVMTLLPQEVVDALGLRIIGNATAQLANDQRISLPVASGLMMTVAGRQTGMDCLVGPVGCEPLIGQLVMEALDLIADPGRRTLTVRPESPLRPTLKLKAVATLSAAA